MILFVFIFYQKLLLICAYPCCYCKWELLILPPHTQCLVSTNPLSFGKYGIISPIPIGFFPFIPIRPFGLCIFFINFNYLCHCRSIFTQQSRSSELIASCQYRLRNVFRQYHTLSLLVDFQYPHLL